jgi:hypothetical protein
MHSGIRCKVPLELVLRARVFAGVDDEINGLRPRVLDVAACRIEVVVARNDLSLAAQQFEEDSLARPSLVRRQDMRHAGDFAEHFLEVKPTARPGVRFVAADHSGPLVGRHRGGAAVGQEVDDHVLGGDLKHIEVRSPQDFLTLLARGEFDRLDHLDLERLDDRFHEATPRS